MAEPKSQIAGGLEEAAKAMLHGDLNAWMTVVMSMLTGQSVSTSEMLNSGFMSFSRKAGEGPGGWFTGYSTEAERSRFAVALQRMGIPSDNAGEWAGRLAGFGGSTVGKMALGQLRNIPFLRPAVDELWGGSLMRSAVFDGAVGGSMFPTVAQGLRARNFADMLSSGIDSGRIGTYGLGRVEMGSIAGNMLKSGMLGQAPGDSSARALEQLAYAASRLQAAFGGAAQAAEGMIRQFGGGVGASQYMSGMARRMVETGYSTGLSTAEVYSVANAAGQSTLSSRGTRALGYNLAMNGLSWGAGAADAATSGKFFYGQLGREDYMNYATTMSVDKFSTSPAAIATGGVLSLARAAAAARGIEVTGKDGQYMSVPDLARALGSVGLTQLRDVVGMIGSDAGGFRSMLAGNMEGVMAAVTSAGFATNTSYNAIYKPSVSGALALAAAGGHIAQAMARDELATKVALEAGEGVTREMVTDFLDNAGKDDVSHAAWAKERGISQDMLQRIKAAVEGLTGQSAANAQTMFGADAVKAMGKKAAEAATKAGLEEVLDRNAGPALGTLIRDAMEKSFTGEKITGAESIIGKEAYAKLGNKAEANRLAREIGDTIYGFQRGGNVTPAGVAALEEKIQQFNSITAAQSEDMKKQVHENALGKGQPVVFNIAATDAINNKVLLNLTGSMSQKGAPAP
jgi:hypothetical protein